MSEEHQDHDGAPASRRHGRLQSDAEEAFASYLQRLDGGEDPDFEGLCGRRPELADDLRRLREAWARIQSAVTRLALKELPGESTDGQPSSGASSGTELIQRLERRKHAGFEEPRYRLEGEVARGGMGRILKVWDDDLRRTLAMKVVLPQSRVQPRADPKTLGRFLEEAQITGQLDHPGVVPVHELGLDDQGQLFFTMRLVKGDHLGQILDEHGRGAETWNLTRVLGIVLRVCEAMAYAHSKQVVHRDLKPANVMVGRFGEVYVMDWGLARVLGTEDSKHARPASDTAPASAVWTDRREALQDRPDSPLLTVDGDVIGTPSYMSPEQARGDIGSLGPAADVYSVGAILYELLSGRAPYLPPDGASLGRLAIWRLVLTGPPQPVAELAPQVPAELVAICERAMAREAGERYVDMQAMSDDLRAFLENRVVQAHRTGPVIELRKWVQRNRTVAVAAALLFLVVLVAAGAFGAERRRTEELQRFSDIAVTQVLLGEGDRLTAIGLQGSETRSSWLGRAEELLARRPGYDRELAELRSRALPGAPDEEARLWDERPEAIRQAALLNLIADCRVALRESRAKLVDADASLPELERMARDIATLELELPFYEAELAALERRSHERTVWRFDDEEDQFLHDGLAQLTGLFDALEDPDSGAMNRVRAELELARTLRERTVDRHEGRWAEACAAIAKAPVYGGLALEPQVGLVPLRADPDAGLWEFWHVLSGEEPVARAEGGYAIEPDTGIVLTLLPGGRFMMGAQSAREWDDNFDPDAHAAETPPLEVALDPFFLSKYELTQGQWIRLRGENPSTLAAGLYYLDYGVITRSHPVERVSWTDAALLEKWDLQLPTEAQWERAARSGTSTPFWFGEEFADGAVLVNHRDRRARIGGLTNTSERDDGYPFHAPVDATHPNHFGLHGILGNVSEWCRDTYADTLEDVVPRPGDGQIFQSARFERPYRGGNFTSEERLVRVSCRLALTRTTRNEGVGLRPGRSLRL